MSSKSKKILKDAIEKHNSLRKCTQTPEVDGDLHGEFGGEWLCDVIACTNISEWVIYYSNRGPGEHHHACTEHVGRLLEDGIQHTIFPIINPQ